MKVKVKASVFVEVDVPDGWDQSDIQFHIEENHCPGTGEVGAAIDQAYAHGKKYSVCWACNLQGQNEILEIDGKPMKPQEDHG